MNDEELKRIFEAWKAPSAGPALDRLVRESWTRSLPRRRHLPLRVRAAAVMVIIAICAAALFTIERSRSSRTPSITRVVTNGDLSGFVPIREVHVTVERRKTVR